MYILIYTSYERNTDSQFLTIKSLLTKNKGSIEKNRSTVLQKCHFMTHFKLFL